MTIKNPNIIIIVVSIKKGSIRYISKKYYYHNSHFEKDNIILVM